MTAARQADRRRSSGDRAVVPDATPRTYYDQPIIKPPVWTWEIPAYFFAGGLAGASSVIAAAAGAVGHETLARSARRVAAAGAAVSPALLISDLGRPDRFHHMLRVIKPTSPMSVGSWVLALYCPAAVAAAALAEGSRLPALRRLAAGTAAALGPVLSTYTGVLVANTAVPVWHEARHEMPTLFAAGSLASAGAAAALAVPDDPTARRLAVTGAVAEVLASTVMERRLGDLGRPYHEGRSGRLARAAKAATAAGAALMASTGHRRPAGAVGAALILAGSALQRYAVVTAGSASARDPGATAGPQRERLASARTP